MKNRRFGKTACFGLALTGFLGGAQSLAAEQTFECMLQPEMIAELGSASPGLLRTVSVKRGQKVSRGQVVAQLLSEVEEAAVAVARARVNATSQMESAEIRKAFSERKHQRTIELSEKKYASDFDLDEARTEMVLAGKALLESRDAMVMAKAELRRAQAYLEMTDIKSPFDGVVVERYHNPGERVEDQPIVKLAKLDPLYVETLLPVHMLGKIAVGDIGVVTTEYNPEETYRATVVVVDAVVDAASGLFGVRLELPNPELLIAAGLECGVTLQEQKIP